MKTSKIFKLLGFLLITIVIFIVGSISAYHLGFDLTDYTEGRWPSQRLSNALSLTSSGYANAYSFISMEDRLIYEKEEKFSLNDIQQDNLDLSSIYKEKDSTKAKKILEKVIVRMNTRSPKFRELFRETIVRLEKIKKHI